jgi:glycosyltransferase 2 family protein
MSTERDGDRRSQILHWLLWLARSVWVRTGVTLVLLVLVGSRLDWSLIATRLREGQPLDFLFAVGLVVLALAAGAWRWHALLYRAGVPLGVGRLARIYAVSTFSSSFLPTTAGGDVTRALLVTRGPDLRRVAVSIVVDRAGGLAGMVGIAWLALAVEPAGVPGRTAAILIWATLALALAGALVLVAMLNGGRAIRRVVPARLLAMARDARDVLRAYGRSPALLTQWLALSILYQGLIAFQLVMLGRAIDVELSFATAAVALTIVTLVTLAPISIGGFGVREGSYVVLLGSVSIAASDATLISVMSVAALLVASLPGAFMIMRGNVGAVAQ